MLELLNERSEFSRSYTPFFSRKRAKGGGKAHPLFPFGQKEEVPIFCPSKTGKGGDFVPEKSSLFKLDFSDKTLYLSR